MRDGIAGSSALSRLPQLYRGPNLRSALVSERLVLLDLSAGEYHVLDEIATLMWMQLLRSPDLRDPGAIAQRYGVAASVVSTDLADFAAEQLAAQRLTPVPGRASPAAVPIIRRRASTGRALAERVHVARGLRRGFAVAYASSTARPADTSSPRIDADRVIAVFCKAENFYPAREAPLDCLPRSLALTRFLRTSGWPAIHVIGVAMYPFLAHAWVELHGRPVLDGPSFLRQFTEIQRA